MTKRIKLRTLLMGGLITLLFLGLIFRVYWVQVVEADFWTKQAMQTWITRETIPQERGMLLDRDGKVLAADAMAYTVAVGPKQIAELEKLNPDWKLTDRIVSKLHIVLGTPEDKLRKIITAKKDDGVTYRDQAEVHPDGWKVDKAIKDRLAVFRSELQKLTDKDNVGLYFMEEQKRYYPNGSLASHILGYENKDGVAIEGLEKKLNDQLRGQPGFIKYQKDGARTQLPNGQVEYKQAVDGKNVTLTIDRDIQFYIEEALRKAYTEYKPISITAIAADPQTMEILGMASLPDYNPNTYGETKDQNSFRDNAIQSLYEPGSTFKIVTLAGAVQEGLFKPDDFYKSGSIKYSAKDRPVYDHNRVGWGQISYLDGLKHSSNVAFVKLGYEMLGKERLVKYITDFGFGQKTGIELPNEVSKSFSLNYPSEVATAAFGQGKVLVTPIQQVAAVAAVANGGKLMQPHIVKSISDPTTGEKVVTEPKLIRQVISAETSRKVGEYLETVVSDQEIGTGKKAYIPGYRIAGKTGTAQKVTKSDETNKSGYSKDRYVVSFIGYAPVDNPKVVLYVVVDEPQIDNAGGGSVAGPIFKEIMGKSLLHLGITPNLPKMPDASASSAIASASSSKDVEVTATVPDVSGMTVTQARSQLKQRSFPVGVLGNGSKVLQQLPKAGSVLPASQQIYLLTDTKPGNVPDLKGMSLRDALEMCSLLKVVCTVDGQGYVKAQKAVKVEGKWILQLTLAPPGQVEAAPPGTAASTSHES
ncbi:penicillin-binding transpeptidase domain-containing protein [Cohnella silvisoli]|uniref:Penicillin-binding transpeptidase domain-containing protein n=1 Tax=Cohnella silvisoli TaxID=2873699 RepID=A0ABV1KYF3_9BACL|nr:penicillin-binding transpeptidase domain-containing protein [Cohnella silvisoli]MCD9024436.1 PASTA domain-containing protein [Cohnella silvisoli]